MRRVKRATAPTSPRGTGGQPPGWSDEAKAGRSSPREAEQRGRGSPGTVGSTSGGHTGGRWARRAPRGEVCARHVGHSGQVAPSPSTTGEVGDRHAGRTGQCPPLHPTGEVGDRHAGRTGQCPLLHPTGEVGADTRAAPDSGPRSSPTREVSARHACRTGSWCPLQAPRARGARDTRAAQDRGALSSPTGEVSARYEGEATGRWALYCLTCELGARHASTNRFHNRVSAYAGHGPSRQRALPPSGVSSRVGQKEGPALPHEVGVHVTRATPDAQPDERARDAQASRVGTRLRPADPVPWRL